MTNENFNNNNILNSENEGIVEKIVDKLMDEKLIDNPFDFLFRSSCNHFPKASHEVLELPGVFEQKLNSSIFSFTGRNLEADYIEKVLPDNEKLFNPAIIILDHMSYRLDSDKIDSSFEYKFSKIMTSNKLCYLFIVTNIKYNEDVLIKMSHYDHFSIRVILIDEDKIQKMLSMLRSKDYINCKFTDKDLIRFVYCLIFSKKTFAKDIIKKLIDLFLSIENITPDYQLYLHFALKTMIKKHYTDEKEIRRLLTMITKKINPKSVDEMPSINYEEKIAELNTEKNIMDSIIIKKELELVESKNELIEKDIELAKKDKALFDSNKALVESSNVIAEKDKALVESSNVIAEKDKALVESSNVIAEKEKALDEKDDEIKKLKQRIELLENGSS